MEEPKGGFGTLNTSVSERKQKRDWGETEGEAEGEAEGDAEGVAERERRLRDIHIEIFVTY
jgi:hypothetical protein